jgi:hypothetical protein
VIGEVLVSPPPERRRGLFAFIAEDLRICQPGVVIDGVMQVGIPAAGMLAVVVLADRASEFAVSSAVGNAAQFLDVDVHEIARSGVFVAASSRSAHW